MNALNQHQQRLQWIADQHSSTVERLITLANINSGSYNLEGLARVTQAFGTLFKPLAEGYETLNVEPFSDVGDKGEIQKVEVGQALRFYKRTEAPLQVLLVGHTDTVFPVDSSFQSCRYLDDNTINGPGVADMKGGLLVMWLALQALEQSPLKDQVGWQVVLNPDEEIGSRSSGPILAQAARSAHLGLVFEPSLPDGTLAGARKGSGNFSLIVSGRSAHAGREFERGRNAIAALSEAMGKLHRLNGQRDGLTINLGRIAGGGPLNMVPERAVCHFNVRTSKTEDEAWFKEHLDRILQNINQEEGIHIEHQGQFTRSPKVINQLNQQLFDLLTHCGTQLGLTVGFKATGGCCDGNNLAAAGLPNIDTLGVQGGNIHTDQEYVLLHSLCQRAQLTYLLLAEIAANKDTFIQSRANAS